MSVTMVAEAKLHSALIIESQPLVQSHLKYSLLALGFTNIDVADRGYLASKAISSNFYDLVLCASDINNGPDGYQLFEKMVVSQLLPNATCFVFLSSEQDLAASQSALELQPDDFILKPYSAKEIESRLTKALKKKLYLRRALEQVDKKNYPAAFEQLNELVNDSPTQQEIQHILKLKGDLLIKLERWSMAKAFFEKLNQKKPSPWSRTSYAQSLVELGEDELAEETLQPLILSSKTSLKAHDLMAKLLFQQERFEQASHHYQKAVEYSPRNLFRLKDYMDLSRLVKDLDCQHQASSAFIRQLKNSIHETPEHYLSAIRSHIDYGFNLLSEEELSRLTQFSQSILNNLRKTFPGVSLTEQVEIAQARILNLKNQPDQARKLVHHSLEKIANGRNYITNVEDSIDQAKALHELGYFKESELVFSQIKQHSSNKKLPPLLTRYLNNEQQLRSEIKDTPKSLNNKAVRYFQRGSFNHALDSFNLAFKLMPKNSSIALNLMQSALESNLIHSDKARLISMVDRCRRTIDEVSLNDEQQDRYDKLNELLLAKTA